MTYADVGAAVEWLTRVFGVVERVRIGDHRAQVSVGSGAVIVADATGDRSVPPTDGGVTHSVMVRVYDIDQHYSRVKSASAQTVTAPTDMRFGERQYSVVDLGGHRWTFTQSIRDLAPEDWGGESVNPW
ncbi:MAG: VOC family protein [Marmoricola sp.]